MPSTNRTVEASAVQFDEEANYDYFRTPEQITAHQDNPEVLPQSREEIDKIISYYYELSLKRNLINNTKIRRKDEES